MYRANIVLSGLTGANRGVLSKQFVTELHAKGVARDEAVEMLRVVFGVPRGAASLFVASHPAWATENLTNDPDGAIPFLASYGGRTLPNRNYG